MKKIALSILATLLISTSLISTQIAYAEEDPKTLEEIQDWIDEEKEGHTPTPIDDETQKILDYIAPHEEVGEVLESPPDGIIYELDGVEGSHYISGDDGKIYEINDYTGEIRELPGATTMDLFAERENLVGMYSEKDGWQTTEDGPDTMPGLGYKIGQNQAEYEHEQIHGPTEEPKPAEPPEEKPAEEEPGTLKDIKFDVGKILSLEDEDQPQEYFESEEAPITAFILSMINFAIRVIGSLAIIILIIGGFMFMFAQGNQTKLDEAKEIVKYAIIGLLVTFLSYIIVISVQSLFIPKSEVKQPQSTEQS